jgi:hypothetical protein
MGKNTKLSIENFGNDPYLKESSNTVKKDFENG